MAENRGLENFTLWPPKSSTRGKPASIQATLEHVHYLFAQSEKKTQRKEDTAAKANANVPAVQALSRHSDAATTETAAK